MPTGQGRWISSTDRVQRDLDLLLVLQPGGAHCLWGLVGKKGGKARAKDWGNGENVTVGLDVEPMEWE
jgi:hypothetical protein